MRLARRLKSMIVRDLIKISAAVSEILEKRAADPQTKKSELMGMATLADGSVVTSVVLSPNVD